MYQTVEAFHRARRMWAVIEGTVLIAPPDCPLSHVEWLAALCGWHKAERYLIHATRGYVLAMVLRAYCGDDFSPAVNMDDVFTAFRSLSWVVPIQWIAFGAVRDDGVVQWPPAVPAVSAWKWAGEQMARIGG